MICSCPFSPPTATLIGKVAPGQLPEEVSRQIGWQQYAEEPSHGAQQHAAFEPFV
jgi:hypothetical protein